MITMANDTQIFLSELEHKLIGEFEEIPSFLKDVLEYSLLGGKRLRPMLIFASYKSTGGKEIAPILPISCAMEYLHTASVLLDDLPCMDNDKMRRGKETVHVRYAESGALLASTYLLNSAYALMGKEKEGKEFLSIATSAVSDTIVGQLLDLQFLSKNNNPTLKTYPLFSACARMGGILSQSSKAVQNSLAEIGKEIGITFQLIDDHHDGQGALALDSIRTRLCSLYYPFMCGTELLEPWWLEEYLFTIERYYHAKSN